MFVQKFEKKSVFFSQSIAVALVVSAAISFTTGRAQATTILYEQDFENPTNFIDTSGRDVSQQAVNDLYGNQPAGFTFAQRFTVETLRLNGNVAFGTGYSDPSGRAGDFLIGMFSTAQPDLLGLAFDVGTNDFLNMSIDITSIDLNGLGGPFVPGNGVVTDAGTEPTFRFSLFDNPGGANGTGAGTALDSVDLTGTVSDRNVVDFTNAVIGLDASGSTNGNVILQFDLLTGAYAGFDNIVIAASDTQGDIGQPVPAPAVLPLFASGLFIMGLMRRRAGDA